jgi:hypothetical protein
MFFFNGFGSVLPYLIYLSLIWICILFGFGQKIRAIVHPQSVEEHTAFISEKTQNVDKSTVFIIGQKSIYRKSSINTSAFKYTYSVYSQFFEIASKIPKTDRHFILNRLLPQFLLRGPPGVIIS